jgi:hypothetical protein
LIATSNQERRKKNMQNFLNRILKVLASLFVFTFFVLTTTAAQSAIKIGGTRSFAIMAGSTITNTGSTVVYGDIGLFPGTSFTGSADIVHDGEVYLTDTDASQAKDALTEAYNDVAGRTPVTIIATELGGQTLLPGVYASESGTFEITGTMTLDAQGDPDAIFIFQMASTLVTAANSKVNLINKATSCEVYWQVGSSATLGTDSRFAGRIYASESITLNNKAEVLGQVLAMTGAVTLDDNVVSSQLCIASSVDDLPNTSDNLINQILLAGSLLMIGLSLLYLARDTYKKD